MESPGKQNRSSEELEMRRLIIPELRKLYPTARIVHELPNRYSQNRIDLAAITETELVTVEIKSSRDTAGRLEKQIRAFLPISARLIVALAPKHNEKLPTIEKLIKHGKSYTPQFTEAQAILGRFGSAVEAWTVCHETGRVDQGYSWRSEYRPWAAQLLDLLWVAELQGIVFRRGLGRVGETHAALIRQCYSGLTGPQIAADCCAALRARPAFGAGSDDPICAPGVSSEPHGSDLFRGVA